MPSLTPYLTSHLQFPLQISADMPNELGMVVVIPCYNEPDLLDTLESIWACQRPKKSVEVIVVINSSENDEDLLVSTNQQSFWTATEWAESHRDEKLRFHVLNFQSIDHTIAGVGLARKLGMDEAVWRFVKAKHNGIILSLDADCRVASNYMCEVESHFENNPDTEAVSIHFEHPLDGDELPKLYAGIVRYELYTRYYIEGLRMAGYPFSWHTLGSCMGVKSDAYQAHGGMNSREAGEDFYFLHNFISSGQFSQVTSTTVYPSSRASERVPFGTGKKMADWMKKRGTDFNVYHPDCFSDLKKTLKLIESCSYGEGLNGYNKLMTSLPYSVIAFFSDNEFLPVWNDIKTSTSGEKAFMARFYQWFDGPKVMAFIHHCRDNFYGEVAIEKAVMSLLEEINGKKPPFMDVRDLLYELREREKKIKTIPYSKEMVLI